MKCKTPHAFYPCFARFLGVILICCLIFTAGASAQKSDDYLLEIRPVTGDQQGASLLRQLKYDSKHKDSAAVTRELNHVIRKLYKKSYLSASIDSIGCHDQVCVARVHVGNAFQWARLKKGNMEEDVLSKTGYRDRIYNQSRFNYSQFTAFTEKILTYYENNGYPFASLKLDSIEFKEDGLFAVLQLEKNKRIVIDSIRIYGDATVADRYLYNYLGIKPKAPYDEANIAAISTRLDELSFVQEERSNQVVFTETETYINLFLKKKKASKFNGIIGILQEENTGRVQLTGDVKLNLQNTFRRGEEIDLNWRGLPNSSQDLKLQFNYPYLFNTPFGVDVDFRLYRRDTIYLDIISLFGIQYIFNSTNYLKVFVNNHSSSLLSTSQYAEATVLPPVLDFTSNLFGSELRLEAVDYRLNPTRGVVVMIGGEGGTKNIRRNANIPEELYEDVPQSSTLLKGHLELDYYLRLSRRNVLLFRNKSEMVRNEQLLLNELYRIGGLKSLRGFDEESIFASAYSVFTFEYRFLLDKNSYLNLFFDRGYYEQNIVQRDALVDRPFGFGAGTTFETNAGIFSVSYALGSQLGNPVDFRSAKIHFGFVNYF